MLDGWVTLSGVVESDWDKYAAGEIARGEAHVRGVSNALAVRRPTARETLTVLAAPPQ